MRLTIIYKGVLLIIFLIHMMYKTFEDWPLGGARYAIGID